MIVQGAQQGNLPVGWVETEDWTNPATGDRTRKWQGPAATLEAAYKDIQKILDNIAGAALAYSPTVSVAGVLAEVAVVIPALGDTARMTPGDVAPPSFSIVPVEYDIPVEQRYVRDSDSASNLAYLPQLDAALKSADPGEFHSWWDGAQENQRRVAYWRIMGVRTYKSNAYTVSSTRYLRRSSTAAETVYARVNKVINWMQVMVLSGVIGNIPEPYVLNPEGNPTPLKWLVRPPRITLKAKWLEVSQNFIGAIRWPADFYSGGNWNSNVGPLGGSTGGGAGGGNA